MKLQFNLTDNRYDLERFESNKALEDYIREANGEDGFDGIELMHMEDDTRGIISKDMVIGYHFSLPEYWLDFWRQDMDKCMEEFDTEQNMINFYGGKTPDALINKIRSDYENACAYGAEYAVIHVSDAAIFEEITHRYKYSDEEVVKAFCEMVNAAVSGEQSENAPWLLMENLWQPGLRFTDPRITGMLMDGINYKKKGIILDTGHLMHTEPGLRSQKEAVRYIHRRLDEHGQLCNFIKGVHLNQSITGPVMRRYMKHPPMPADSYEKRVEQLFEYVFSVDQHKPFTGEGVVELVERIQPQYLTYEFISRDLEEHEKMLKKQHAVFRRRQEIR